MGVALACLQGYAYILTHPGIPTIFYDHLFEWGEDTKNAITELVSTPGAWPLTFRFCVRMYLCLCIHSVDALREAWLFSVCVSSRACHRTQCQSECCV